MNFISDVLTLLDHLGNIGWAGGAVWMGYKWYTGSFTDGLASFESHIKKISILS
ncbi:hypothetical protein [Dyadobacter jiangsuensis]|uniref:hypothetical protein n=1 Tax=Dyadobacter jiangsuensis TaxID=1591085 RepID=UPI001475777C|nr:hypothetical protein [Dyadobacter jiangsuensis]